MSTTVQQVTLTAPDMSCGHCETTITRALGALDGVDRVEANAASKNVTVAFDPNRISLTQIEAALDEEGYPVQK